MDCSAFDADPGPQEPVGLDGVEVLVVDAVTKTAAVARHLLRDVQLGT